ncbi:hypothetical protein R3W88_033445 [Solanum pinnatisectum]|uniref:Uncharacterized protein n=1 Tax=Solanum pinnatisectum TaxID=50273 RepID=A0AAV9K109_9SOLN|nr:hypothetical protein R3W88_033445 [Solanum pinnatisectum]
MIGTIPLVRKLLNTSHHLYKVTSEKVLLMKSSTHQNVVVVIPSRRDENLSSWCVPPFGFDEVHYMSGYWEWVEDVLSYCKETLDNIKTYDVIITSMFIYDHNESIFYTFCENQHPSTNTISTFISGEKKAKYFYFVGANKLFQKVNVHNLLIGLHSSFVILSRQFGYCQDVPSALIEHHYDVFRLVAFPSSTHIILRRPRKDDASLSTKRDQLQRKLPYSSNSKVTPNIPPQSGKSVSKFKNLKGKATHMNNGVKSVTTQGYPLGCEFTELDSISIDIVIFEDGIVGSTMPLTELAHQPLEAGVVLIHKGFRKLTSSNLSPLKVLLEDFFKKHGDYDATRLSTPQKVTKDSHQELFSATQQFLDTANEEEVIWTNTWKSFKKMSKNKETIIIHEDEIHAIEKLIPLLEIEIKEPAKLKEDAETSRHQILIHKLFS